MLAMRVVQRRFRSIPIIFLRVTDNRMNQTFPPSGALRHGYIVIPFAGVLPDILEIRFDGISIKDLVRPGICFSDDLQSLFVDNIPKLPRRFQILFAVIMPRHYLTSLNPDFSPSIIPAMYEHFYR